MAFFTTQRNGFTKVSSMLQQVVNDMADHGFRIVYPLDYSPTTELAAPAKIILEATSAVDPLSSTQPWRVAFNLINEQSVGMYVATPLQLTDDGTIATLTDSSAKVLGFTGSVGKLDAKYDEKSVPAIGFVNRSIRMGVGSTTPTPVGTTPLTNPQNAFPLNYRLTISDHGFFLGSWEGNWASVIFQNAVDSYTNWVVVQRPVNKLTGAPLVTGRCPVFCVNKVDSSYWKFVVREADIPHPTPPVIANAHSEDNFRVINTQNQVSISEDKTYLISFINNLNTPRFRYTEELDLVGVVSADVVIESIPLQLTAFGKARTYIALPGSNDYNTGVKILVMTNPGA